MQMLAVYRIYPKASAPVYVPRSVMNIGVLHFPDFEYPCFKVYHSLKTMLLGLARYIEYLATHNRCTASRLRHGRDVTARSTFRRIKTVLLVVSEYSVNTATDVGSALIFTMHSLTHVTSNHAMLSSAK